MNQLRKQGFNYLSSKEIKQVNGGTLLEDIGCVAHKAYCAVEDTYNSAKEWVKETYNDISTSLGY